MDSVEAFPFPPSSQLILSASAAVLARHHESATTATAFGSFTTLRTPGMPLSFESSTDFERTLEHGALDQGRVEHVRHANIDAVDGFALNLVTDVEPLCRLARNLPFLR